LCPGPREIFSEFVETAGHNAISSVERFFHSIPMVAVNVDIQNAWIGSEEFKDTQNDVVDVTKA
jgi:hypothetical protein